MEMSYSEKFQNKIIVINWFHYTDVHGTWEYQFQFEELREILTLHLLLVEQILLFTLKRVSFVNIPLKSYGNKHSFQIIIYYNYYY